MGGLSVRQACVRFGATAALDQVDLDVDTGEIVAVLGASGSGKSTLLRAIAGLQELDSGRILFDDQDLTRLPVHRRGFGLMFQDGQLFAHLDVAQNIAYPLRRQRVPAARRTQRIEELLELVGLTGLGERAVTTLSGGQQQRVALARALASSPRLMLLDEPLSALDRDLRERLAVDVREILRTTGTTALLVTHDRDEAAVIADRTVTMTGGALH